MERGPPACGTPSPGCGGGRGHGPPPSVGPGGGSLGLYPRWRLLRHALEHLVYPVILDHHCGDTRGGGGRGWAWGHERGWLHTLLLPHPPPSSLQPHRCLVPRARVWDPYPIGCGMVGCPPRQPGVGGWMGKWGWEGPPLRAAAPLMRATGAEWVMTQWGGQHRAPTASLAAVWCYGGGCEDPPTPPTLVNSIIRLPPTQSSPLGQNPPTAIGISRAPPDRPPQPGRAPPAASSLCRTPQHPPLGLPQPH